MHSARITGEDANIEIASLHTARGGENRPQPKTTALTGRTGMTQLKPALSKIAPACMIGFRAAAAWPTTR